MRCAIDCELSRLINRPAAQAMGLGDANIRTLIRRGLWIRESRGAYRSACLRGSCAVGMADADGILLRRAVSVAMTTSAVVSHRAALLLHGLPTLGPPPQLPCLTMPLPTHESWVSRAHLHRCEVPSSHQQQAFGITVTSVARTILDVARKQGPLAGIIAGDAALATGLDHSALTAALEDCHRWPGKKRAIRCVQFLDRRSESPLESISRWKIDQAGLPVPQLQAELADRFGRYIRRVDFFWEEAGVVGEVDGLTKYADNGSEQVRIEQSQQSQLEECGLIVIRWNADQLRDFTGVANRLRTALNWSRRPMSWSRIDEPYRPGIG